MLLLHSFEMSARALIASMISEKRLKVKKESKNQRSRKLRLKRGQENLKEEHKKSRREGKES